jgi:hypothetical protein
MDKNIKDVNMESKKTEKLVTALYLLTSFFDDKEPMKWRLRELGGSLIGQKEPRAVVLEIMGLMTIAKNAGLISDMNYAIVHKEFAMLAPQEESLSQMFRQIETREETRLAEPSPRQEARLEERERRPAIYVSSSVSAAPVVKDKSREAPTEGVVALKKNGRQNVILGLLRKKKEIMIKDVSPLIDGVSEKTIQRELLAMVQAGILRKEGEKRWSRYTLA